MLTRRGIAVSPGVAIGPALVLDLEWFRISQRILRPEVRLAEAERLRRGLTKAAEEARRQQAAVTEKLGSHYSTIFGAHVMMIEDPGLFKEAERLICKEGHTSEFAFSKVIRQYARMLESMEGTGFAARVADLMDIEKHVLRSLLGQQREHLSEMEESVVVLAHDLSPSETAAFDPKRIHGFATEAGGPTSHTAILAGALHLPAVVGLGEFVLDVAAGDTVIVDGNQGLLILDPDEETLKRYKKTRKSHRSQEQERETELRDLTAQTEDDIRVELMGNIEFPEESKLCVELGGEGVGLYRTEFLYLNKTTDPTEEDHLDAYLKVIRTLGERPVVIRTLDLGADKFARATGHRHPERNPFLGLRSIRFCLKSLDLFKTQMRAILRASAEGDVRIMFPMISTLSELIECKEILEQVKKELGDQNVPFDEGIKIGTMIEVPSAALMADVLAREVDFFSIGTNDLIQYTLAADRTNEAVASLYNAGDPAVLRLIQMVCEAGHRHDVYVNVCGQMSGDPLYVPLLVGMGLRRLSVTPHSIPDVKKIIRSITTTEAETIAHEALCKETARGVNEFLREHDRRLRPDFYRT